MTVNKWNNLVWLQRTHTGISKRRGSEEIRLANLLFTFWHSPALGTFPPIYIYIYVEGNFVPGWFCYQFIHKTSDACEQTNKTTTTKIQDVSSSRSLTIYFMHLNLVLDTLEESIYILCITWYILGHSLAI